MELTIKKEVTNNVTLKLPIFWKKPQEKWIPNKAEYLAVLNEETCADIYTSQDRDVILVGLTSPRLRQTQIEKAYESWEEISEAEFLNAHRWALQSLSLEPQLVNRNDIKDVL